jgi:hypothetical protein
LRTCLFLAVVRCFVLLTFGLCLLNAVTVGHGIASETAAFAIDDSLDEQVLQATPPLG